MAERSLSHAAFGPGPGLGRQPVHLGERPPAGRPGLGWLSQGVLLSPTSSNLPLALQAASCSFFCAVPLEDLDKSGEAIPCQILHLNAQSLSSRHTQKLRERERRTPPSLRNLISGSLSLNPPRSIVCLGDKVCVISFQHEGRRRSGRQV